MSFHPDKVRTPTESLHMLLDGKSPTWSPMGRVDHVLEAADLRLLDSRMFRGSRHFLVLTPQNIVDRFQGFQSLEAYALGIVRAHDSIKNRQ